MAVVRSALAVSYGGAYRLKLKLPPPFQNVVYLDRRIQTLDSPESRPIFTAEKKSLVIDWLVKWRIKEPREFIRNNI